MQGDYLVQASALRGFEDVVAELGGDPDALLRRQGLGGVGPDPAHWISYRAWLHLLDDSARALDCPHFGLLLSARQDIGVLGVLGFMVRRAPDVRTALRELGTYFNHHNQGATISLRVEDDIYRWEFAPRPGLDAPLRHQSDLVAGISVKFMRLLVGSWRPLAIYLPHSAPADTRPYRERFDCPVHFDWDSTIIASDARFLDHPLTEADPEVHRILEDQVRELKSSFPDDFPGLIRHLIRQGLTTGDCSIERVADYLAINKRTLQRRLRQAGTGYRELLDTVRFEIARNYLRESQGSLTALSDMLCYSELSAFSNAFNRHFGMSPRQWAKTQASAPPGAP
ncbi:MAG: AraC family transcriptional regulator [Halioglobus sp.]|nr:AraC family transcriptional regulator [Halioglobus sp.]